MNIIQNAIFYESQVNTPHVAGPFLFVTLLFFRSIAMLLKSIQGTTQSHRASFSATFLLLFAFEFILNSWTASHSDIRKK